MDIRYHILWPGGNATALVEGDFPRAEYASIARKILSEDSRLEQVGFLEKPSAPSAHVRLQMMGGEFCGNAARSVAYLWEKLHGINRVIMEVSGFDGLLTCDVGEETATLQLPGHFFVQGSVHDDSASTVDLAGIRHVVSFGDKKQNIADIKQQHADVPAVGVMHVTEANGILKMDPIVYVKATDTVYNETACGSGSIATAIAAHLYRNFPKDIHIEQPTGEQFRVTIEKTPEDTIHSIILHGRVTYLGDKTIPMDL